MMPTRREMLVGAGAALGVGALAAMGGGSLVAVAGEAREAMHAMAHGRKNVEMVDVVSGCVRAGADCIAHCLALIKEGDTTIIDCLRSAQEMEAFCKAHLYLAAADSEYLNEVSALAIKICGRCARECDKHARKHAVCKACRDACETCVKACKKHLGMA